MRARQGLVVALVCARAHADPLPVDRDLLAYIADAEARAEASPETITIDDAAPVDTPSAGVRTVDARTIALTPKKHADDLLRLVPGLYTSQHGAEGKAQQFFVRGFDAVHGADLAIRVAGIPINEHSNVHGQGYADLGFVVPEAVSGLVARKGPFDLEQGWFATAGSLDLELGVATARGKRVGYEVGSTNRHRVLVLDAPEEGATAELVAADFVHDEGYGENRGATHGSVLGQTELSVGRLRLRPLAVAYWSRFGEPGVLPIADIERGSLDRTSATAPDLGGRSQRLLVGLGASYTRGANELVASSHLGWRGLRIDENFTGYLESPMGDGRRQSHAAVTGGTRIAWRHRVSRHARVLAGTELVVDQLSQAESRITDAGVIWRDERSLAATTSSVGGWAGLEYKRGRLVVTGGARVEAMHVAATDRIDAMRSGARTLAAVSPRIAVAWRGTHGTLSLAAGRGQRPPEARAFTQRPARENMETTTYDGGEAAITAADAIEAGGELVLGSAKLGAAAFATWIERESVFDHLSGGSALRDGSRRLGGELFVEAKPTGWLALRGDVTAVDARFVVTENPIPGAPRLLASAEARIDHAPWTAGIGGRFLGARPLLHGATASAQTMVDAAFGYTHGRWLFQLQLDNVLGQPWNEGEYNFASHWDRAQPRSELPRVHISPGRPFGARLGATVHF